MLYFIIAIVFIFSILYFILVGLPKWKEEWKKQKEKDATKKKGGKDA